MGVLYAVLRNLLVTEDGTSITTTLAVTGDLVIIAGEAFYATSAIQ